MSIGALSGMTASEFVFGAQAGGANKSAATQNPSATKPEFVRLTKPLKRRLTEEVGLISICSFLSKTHSLIPSCSFSCSLPPVLEVPRKWQSPVS